MDTASFIKEIGGGLSAVVIVVQFLALLRLYNRKEALHDKLLSVVTQNGAEAREMHSKTLDAMAALTTANAQFEKDFGKANLDRIRNFK